MVEQHCSYNESYALHDLIQTQYVISEHFTDTFSITNIFCYVNKKCSLAELLVFKNIYC